jgi:hypothetical protein
MKINSKNQDDEKKFNGFYFSKSYGCPTADWNLQKIAYDSDLYFNKKKYLQAWKFKMAAKYDVAV